MARPQTVNDDDWAKVVEHSHLESDRGFAVLVGSFVEHALGTFLTHRIADKDIAEKLFGPVGPLSSFSQRIIVAYAFGLLSKEQYQDLEAIRQARNEFAHNPLHANFQSPEVQKHTKRMSHYEADLPEGTGSLQRNRLAYEFTCASLLFTLLGPGRKNAPVKGKVASKRAKSAA